MCVLNNEEEEKGEEESGARLFIPDYIIHFFFCFFQPRQEQHDTQTCHTKEKKGENCLTSTLPSPYNLLLLTWPGCHDSKYIKDRRICYQHWLTLFELLCRATAVAAAAGERGSKRKG